MRKVYANAQWGLTGEIRSLIVEDGRVIETASTLDVPEAIDLRGKWILPALIDAHCHVLPTGLDLQKLHLGACSTKVEVLDAVRDWERTLEGDRWLLAVHYDQNRFDDSLHLTRHELDAISNERPILLRHVNGHASVANTAALRRAGLEFDAPDPAGGSYGRDETGLLNGVAFEDAHERVNSVIPAPTLEEMVDAILRAGKLMASRGILCASDMMTGRFNLLREIEAYRLAAEQGSPVRIRLYCQWSEVFGRRGIGAEPLRAADALLDSSTCRVAGIKIFADGAIGSASAAIYGRYSGEKANGPILSKNSRSAGATAPDGVEVSGQLIYSPDRLNEMVRTADEAGFQVSIHTIGDYSTDLVMSAYEALGDAAKHRIEHAMILSNQQVERMARLGSFCTMQPEFLYRFGVTYLKQLGPERAAKINRMRSVTDAGIPLSLSSDMPITSGDPWLGMDAAVNRPAGFDPAEGLTAEEALVGYTSAGADVNLDADLGSLQPSQWADFLILNEDPRTLKDVSFDAISGLKTSAAEI